MNAQANPNQSAYWAGGPSVC